VFEIKFDAKSGAFLECKRAFELKGHNSGVWSVSFSADAKRALTISKDGRFRVYDTDIRYAQGEDAHLLHSGSLDCLRDARHRSICALAPSASSFAIAHATSLYLFAVDADQPVVELDNVHSTPITSVVYSTDSRFVFTAGDRHVRCFHNVAGWQHQLRHAGTQLVKVPKTSSALRERLQQQIDEAESILSKLGV